MTSDLFVFRNENRSFRFEKNRRKKGHESTYGYFIVQRASPAVKSSGANANPLGPRKPDAPRVRTLVMVARVVNRFPRKKKKKKSVHTTRLRRHCLYDYASYELCSDGRLLCIGSADSEVAVGGSRAHATGVPGP